MVENFGAFMKRIRGIRTLTEISKLTGVSMSYLSKIESNERKRPSAKVLKVLAPAYMVTYRELMQAAGYISDEDITLELTPDIDKLKIKLETEGLYNFTDDEIQKIISYAKFLKYGQ